MLNWWPPGSIKEVAMCAKKDDTVLQELMAQAADWIEKEFPNRMQAVGVDEEEIRSDLKIEADHWVEYNVEQRSQGKEGTSTPDVRIKE